MSGGSAQAGSERAELLEIVAARTFDSQGSAAAEQISDLLNSALELAAAGDLEEAATADLAALAVYDARPAPEGYDHDYPLQAGAAIALLRAGELYARLGRDDRALACFGGAHDRFSSAYEEQFGEEYWWARQLAAEGLLRKGDLLERMGRHDEARRAWSRLLPVRGFVWPSLEDWAAEAEKRLHRP